MKKQFFYIILLAAIYFVTARIGLVFAFEKTNATAVWAPTGIALAVLLLGGNRYWPAIFIGAFAVNFQVLYSGGLPINSVLAITFFTAIGNTLEALVGAFLLRHFTKNNTSFNTFKDIMLFIFLGAFISTLLSASIGSISYCIFTNNGALFRGMLTNWWLGDALGVLTVTPVILFWKQKEFHAWKVNKYLELIMFIGVIALFTYYISETNYPIKFLLTPILLWSVFRFGKFETFVFILFISFSALFLNSSAYISGTSGPSRSILIFQLYFGAIAITFLILSAVLSESSEAKKLVKESEERFRTIFDSVNDGIFVHDAKTGRILDVNKRTLEMFGYSHTEILKLSVGEISSNSSPYTQEEGIRWIRKAIKGQAQVFEWQSKRKDGSLFWSEVNMRYASIDGKDRVLVSVRDISERKKVEEALRTEQEFSKKIIDTSTALIIGFDKNHLIRLFNKGAENSTGYQKTEVIGKDWFKLFLPDEISDEMNKVWKEAWGARTLSYVNSIRVKSGKERIISFQNTGIYEGEDDSKHLLISIGEDITERKLAETKLRESQTFNQTLLNTSPDLIYIYDSIEKKNIYSNAGITKILGYSSEEIHNFGEKLLSELMHPDDFKRYLKETIPLYQTAADDQIIDRDYRMKHKDGTWRWLNSKETIFLRQEDGTPKQIFGLSSDITERKKYTEEINQLNIHLEQKVKERTQELEKKNKILEKMNKVFVGREVKMAELKKEIEKLKGH